MKLIMFSFILLCLSHILPAQEYAIQQLENSPRHHEWVKIASKERNVHAFVAYPEVAKDAQAVVVIHENRGLTDWVRSFADQMAALGYLAIAPDLLSDFDENHEKTSTFENSDAARNAIYQLDADQVTNDLQQVVKYISKANGSNGQVSVVGFCWGGGQSFRFATNSSQIKNAFVFYGSGPMDAADIARIHAPVYGFYGENDQRVNATIEKSEALMKSNNKKYEYVIYPGAGHAYMRIGDDPEADQASKAATKASYERIKEILGN